MPRPGDEPRPPVLLRAAWVAPMHRPLIRDGGVVISGTSVAAIGRFRELARAFPDAEVHDAGEAVILPGLVNAHTHLELTRFDRRPLPPGGLVGWVLELRRRAAEAYAGDGPDGVAASVAEGIGQCSRFGVTCVGDISYNTSIARRVLHDAPLHGVSYGEVLGMAGRAEQFDALMAAAADRSFEREGLRAGVEPHAPYSLDLANYRRSVAEAKRLGLPLATHLAETPDEATFLARHAGPFRELWEALGAWSDGVSRFDGGPVRAMAEIGLLDLPALLAHVNYCDDAELDLLAAGRASVVYCPRTHAYFGHPPHRWRDMLARGINVAVGTDSCASSPDLNLVDDLRLIHETAPEVPPETLWDMATVRGAAALGIPAFVGTLAPGMAGDCAVFPVTGDEPLRYVLQNPVLPQEVWHRGERTT